MISIDDNINLNSTKLLSQIHDELIFEIKDETLRDSIKIIKDIMENVIKLDVALPVRITIGKEWGSMLPYQGDNLDDESYSEDIQNLLSLQNLKD
jgi:DNA polymerase I-like protein with 3'-5' exonuclease and polymerase domains